MSVENERSRTRNMLLPWRLASAIAVEVKKDYLGGLIGGQFSYGDV